MADDFAIKVEHVTKTFKLPHEKNSSLKSALINFRKRGYEKQVALKDISFEVKKGEFFGIVGRNGSGKSTLLKLISGIYAPDAGNIAINGKLTPFIELGVGFNPELSGRDNVFLNGALLGFNRKEMAAMYDEIVDFAELGRFMDQKLKNYSSGMQVRLAFSIAIRANTDVLVLDEVLAVGDASFQQKCFDYFEKLRKNKTTIIIVTHDMSAVKRFCNRALLIEDGDIKVIGSPDDVADQYLFDNLDTKKDTASAGKDNKLILKEPVKELDVIAQSALKLKSSDELVFDVAYRLSKEQSVYLGFSIIYSGISIAEHNSLDVELPSSPGKKHTVHYSLPLTHINPGVYKLYMTIFDSASRQPLGHKFDACSFVVTGNPTNKGGPLLIRGNWQVKG